MKRVLIKGYYGHENLGDDFILYTILQTLNECGRYKITVVSSGDKYESLFKLFDHLSCEVLLKPWRKFTKLYQLMKNNYWLIGGGGLFPSEDKADFRSLLSEIKAARKFKTKVCMYGIDINSISREENKEIWREISKNVDFIICRNLLTYSMLRELGCRNIYKSSDITFSAESKTERQNTLTCLDKIGCEKENYILWAIPMPWFDSEYKEELHGKRYRKLVSDIQAVINQDYSKGYKHVFLPFYYDMDMKIISDIVKGINVEYSICDKAKGITLEEKRQLFRLAKASVCMRFHGAMFSLYHQTPVAVISYSNKTSDVMKEYGLQEDLIEYGIRKNADFYSEFDLQFERLNKIVFHVITERKRSDYSAISSKLKANAENSKKILQNWLQQKGGA